MFEEESDVGAWGGCDCKTGLSIQKLERGPSFDISIIHTVDLSDFDVMSKGEASFQEK